MKKIINIEHNGEELILKLEHVGIKEIGIMIGDALESICNDSRMLGNNTSEEAKDVLMNIILDKLGYCLGDEE